MLLSTKHSAVEMEVRSTEAGMAKMAERNKEKEVSDSNLAYSVQPITAAID